jgi:phosphomannomutase / phosphoglucomutase
MTLAPHIFREYDIRGIVGRDLDAGVAEPVGRAYASLVREQSGKERPRVVVGRDNRPSSPELAQALVRGIRAAGVDVLDIGTVPTPMVYWTEATRGTDGAVQITGSHNPAEWNGIKMTVGGRAIYGATIQALRERIEQQKFASGAGGYVAEDVSDDYVEDVAGRFRLARPIKVAVDCGNGSGALIAERLFAALGAEVVPLFCQSDGTFPNHHPDPTVDENLVDLIAAVQSEGCELGVAFDGDADRVGAVDEHGAIVRGDLILLLFGLDLIQRKGPGQKMVFDVKCSQALPEVFGAAGGEPIMWKTGHSLMKEKMRSTGAALAGELSGHICVGGDQYYGFDDALFDACLLIDLVARSERPLSERVAEFPSYVSTPEIRVEVTEESKWAVMKHAKEHFASRYDVVDVDGVRVQFGDGWGLVRASNTQPVLVLRFEARTQERLDEIRRVMEEFLRLQGVELVAAAH